MFQKNVGFQAYRDSVKHPKGGIYVEQLQDL